MRLLISLALATALVGCDEKKEVTPAAAVAPSGAAVAPSGAAVAPSGAAVAPSAEAVKPSGEAAEPVAAPSGKSEKPAVKAGATTKVPPAPSGGMPHGNPEDGTLKYNPPPAQNPPAKK